MANVEEKRVEVNENKLPLVPSDNLVHLRDFIRLMPDLQSLIGNAVEFRVVVDANIVLKDLGWLAKNNIGKNLRTGLIEAVDAGTISLHAPDNLISEVEGHIPDVTKNSKTSEENFWHEWANYRKRIVFHNDADEIFSTNTEVVDPDDIPYIQLATKIGAVGILSKDKHIAAMGGNALTVDFVFAARDYSRAAAVEFQFKVCGVGLGWVGIVAFQGVFNALKAVFRTVGNLPTWAKLLIAGGVFFALIHPDSRKKITNTLSAITGSTIDLAEGLIEKTAELSTTAMEHQKKANIHLSEAMDCVGKI